MKNLETYDSVVAINVDVQNDFCPGGSLAVPEGDAVIAPLNRLNRWVRDENGLVVFTRDWHPAVTSHFDKWPVHCVQNRAGAAFHDDLKMIDSTEYFTGSGHDLVASKGMGKDEDAYSGFEAVVSCDTVDSRGYGGVEGVRLGRLLENFMRGNYMEDSRRFPAERKLESLAIVVGGLATDYCVRATVLDALKFKDDIARSYDPKRIGVYALTDAMRAVNIQPEDGEKAIFEMTEAGATLTTVDEVIDGKVFAVTGGQR
jgi:nicotinamidase/pyrazinamidase